MANIQSSLITDVLKSVEKTLFSYEDKYQTQIKSLLKELVSLTAEFKNVLFTKRTKVKDIECKTLEIVSSDISLDDKLSKIKSHFKIYLDDLEKDIVYLKGLRNNDHLTNLYNRRYFDEYLTDCLAANKYFSLFMLDIDHFKNVNDTYGHSNGDQVLQIVATIIQKLCNTRSIVFRYGGEEFAIISKLKYDDAIKLAESIRLSIANNKLKLMRQNKVIDDNIRITISIGVIYCNFKTSPEQIIAAADQLLYQAKNNGRNRIEYAPL